jgi:hypothetical protein
MVEYGLKNQVKNPWAVLGAGVSNDKCQSPKWFSWLWSLALVAAAIVGAIVGRLFPPFELDEGFWRTFLTSAGFGGSMAVVAATIAYLAARHSAKSSRMQATEDREQRKISDRKEQWWARAEWALNQVSSETGDTELGYRMLNALGQSEWAEEHEADIIAAATEEALSAEEIDQDATADPEDSTQVLSGEKMDTEGGAGFDK